MSGIMLAVLNSGGGGGGGLYAFTNFTFTNAGVTGYTGPSLAQCITAYNSTTYPWLTNTAYFNMTSNGIQRWTVPTTGSYRFTAKGASGGNNVLNGGLAAQMVSTFNLNQGDIIQILVGQMGSNGTGNTCGTDGGGGGGSFVATSGGSLLLASGGGGGGASNSIGQTEFKNAIDGTSGRNGAGGPPYGGTGGTGGAGGTYNTGSCVAVGSTGAGWTGDGSGLGPTNAVSISVGGGTGGFTSSSAFGGFGGGGAPGTNYCAGGGGGYSGGGGGGLSACDCRYMGAGGAGGSFSSTTYTFSTLSSAGHGSIFVEKL